MEIINRLTIPEKLVMLKLAEESTDWHTHDFLEIAYLVSGNATHVIGSQKGDLQPGDFFAVDFDTPHAYQSDGIVIINCLFRPEWIHSKFANIRSFNQLIEQYYFGITGRRMNGPAADRIFHDETGVVGALFEQMVKEYEAQQEGYLEMLHTLLCQILLHTIRLVGTQKPPSPLSRNILDQIDAHFQKGLTLRDICQEHHYSLSYASYKFKEDTGLTFTQALQNRRIEESCRLLSQTKLPVTQVAELSGYKNIKFFNKIFRQLLDMSPRQFRKQNRLL